MSCTNTIKTCDCAELELKDGYLLIKYKDMSVINIEEAKRIISLGMELCNNEPYPVIIDGSYKSIQMNNEARNYFSKNPLLSKITKSLAIVVNNTPSRLLARFFIKFHKPMHPVKVFSNLADAEDWTNTFKH